MKKLHNSHTGLKLGTLSIRTALPLSQFAPPVASFGNGGFSDL